MVHLAAKPEYGELGMRGKPAQMNAKSSPVRLEIRKDYNSANDLAGLSGNRRIRYSYPANRISRCLVLGVDLGCAHKIY